MSTFVKAMRGDHASFLDLHPNANHLLNVIARRARRTPCKLNGLDVGESFIAHKTTGLTEQQYRTAKKNLQKWGLVSFKVARRLTGGVTAGVTVATLLNSDIYDINTSEGNATVTPEQRHGNATVTSNKECKNDNNEKKVNIHQQIVDTWNNKFSDYEDISQVLKLTPKRKSAINGCINEMKSTDIDLSLVETWSSLFDYASSLDFLTGKNKDGWTMSFDFITTKSKLIKLIEGDYDNKQPNS